MKIKRIFFLLLVIASSMIFLACKQNSSISLSDGTSIALDELDAFVKTKMEELQMVGISLAIINENQIVYQSALGLSNLETGAKVDKQTIFEAASLSKPVFAYFALKLSEKGVIDLDRPLHFYLPEEDLAIDPRYKQVSARQVLSHSTGFPNWRWFSDIPDSIDINRGEFFMLQDPGSGFTYSGEAYQYLARVLAHNSFLNLKELADLFHKEVTKPLDMEHAYFVWDDFLHLNKAFGHAGMKIKREWGSGLPHHTSQIMNAAGGLHTEAQSYAQFLIALMNREGLYGSTFEQMFAAQTKLPSDHSYTKSDSITAWGLGLAIARNNGQMIYRHGGNNTDFQAEFAICPDKQFGYVFFTNCDKGKEFKIALEEYLGLR